MPVTVFDTVQHSIASLKQVYDIHSVLVVLTLSVVLGMSESQSGRILATEQQSEHSSLTTASGASSRNCSVTAPEIENEGICPLGNFLYTSGSCFHMGSLQKKCQIWRLTGTLSLSWNIRVMAFSVLMYMYHIIVSLISRRRHSSFDAESHEAKRPNQCTTFPAHHFPVLAWRSCTYRLFPH